MSFIAVHFAFVVAYLALAAALGVGAVGLVERRGPLAADPLERWMVALALGIGLVGQVVFALGLVGGIDRLPVVAVLLVLAVIGVGLIRSRWHDWRIGPTSIGGVEGRSRQRLGMGRRLTIAVWVILVLGPVLALALYPPSGFDEGLYHLPFAERFVEAGRLVFAPELRYPVFPQLAEMGFVLALLTVGDTAAGLAQAVAYLLVAGLLFAWGRGVGGDGGSGSRIGAWAAALWLGTPLAVWIGSQAYVDVGLTLHVTAGLHAWDRWLGSRGSGEGAGERDGRWLALAGIQIGFAAATKYLGLFFFGVLGLATVILPLLRVGGAPSPSPLRRLRSALVSGAVFGLAVLAVAGPWYGRIVAQTGNPVFPFYTPLFGDNEWRHAHDDLLLPGGPSAAGPSAAGPSAEEAPTELSAMAVVRHQVGRAVSGLGFLARTPWASLFDRQVFDRQAPLSPYFLLLLPWALPLALASPGARRGLALALAYALFWLVTERDIRFLFPILPLLSLCTAVGLHRAWGWARERSRIFSALPNDALAGVLAALLLLPGPAYGLYKLGKKGPLPTTEQARVEHLAAQVPGYAALDASGRFYDRETVSDSVVRGLAVYGLYLEQLHYHAPGRFVGDWFGLYAYDRLQPHLGDGEALFRELRSMDACWLLVRTEAGSSGAPAWTLPGTADFERRFQRLAVSEIAAGPHPITGEVFALYALRGFECPRPPTP